MEWKCSPLVLIFSQWLVSLDLLNGGLGEVCLGSVVGGRMNNKEMAGTLSCIPRQQRLLLVRSLRSVSLGPGIPPSEQSSSFNSC